MLFSIKNRDDLEKLNKKMSLLNQLKELRLRDKLGRQNFHENMKKYLNQFVIQLKIHVET